MTPAVQPTAPPAAPPAVPPAASPTAPPAVPEAASAEAPAKEAAATEPIPYPKAIYFIIGNEFCERFSFYGMRTVLTLFLVNVLMFEEHTAKTVFHAFVTAAYFTPILGAMIADSYLGKYHTIFYISIVYALGNIALAVASTPLLVSHTWVPLVGLAVIAFGTGGIKPCVSAFGGDQFLPGQEKQLEQFFSLFYIAINAGSLLSTYITPVLRVQKCLGQASCFPLAFGVPAALMVVALVLFVIGKPMYRIIPPAGNVVLQVIKCIWHALMMRIQRTGEKKEHWLDYADDKFEKNVISDIKSVLHVLVLYIPLPLFWALFDQQGSQWTLQANKMNGEFFGFQVLPDQIQLANPLLILILVPIFSYCVYPFMERFNLLNRPLQKITVGGLAAAAAFSVAGGLDLVLEGAAKPAVPAGHVRVTFVNSLPIGIQDTNGILKEPLGPYMVLPEQDLPVPQGPLTFHADIPGAPVKPGTLDGPFEEGESFTVFFLVGEGVSIRVVQVQNVEAGDRHGAGVRVVYSINDQVAKVEFRVEGADEVLLTTPADNSSSSFTNVTSLMPATYTARVVGADDKEITTCKATVKNGGEYILLVTQFPDPNGPVNCSTEEVVKPHTVSMFLQLPQYILITIGEVMFSITGLEFSYSQAPSSMKSVLQAAWLITVAAGNLIVVVIAESRFFKVASAESFMYSGLMALDMVVFGIMASFYKYIEPAATKHEGEEAKKRDEEEALEKTPEKMPLPQEGDAKP